MLLLLLLLLLVGHLREPGWAAVNMVPALAKIFRITRKKACVVAKCSECPPQSGERNPGADRQEGHGREPALKKYLPEIEPHGFLHSPVIGIINIVIF
jgi:hypothetical protein